jgi:hypothetical protein
MGCFVAEFGHKLGPCNGQPFSAALIVALRDVYGPLAGPENR